MTGLEWRGSMAYRGGRLLFNVVREPTGWKLYRYSVRNSGEVILRSKEHVRTKAAGCTYAEALAMLSSPKEKVQ